MRRRHVAVALATSALLLGLGPAALADEARTPRARGSDPAAAQALFYEARTLMKAGRWTEACPKLEESLRLDRGIGTTFNLADCNQHLGKLATAWSGFLDVAAAAKSAGQAERAKLARARAGELEPRLPKLVIEVPRKTPGLVVERDGVAVGEAAFGTALPVDPGPHRVTARAPGFAPLDITVDAREARTARVAVPELAAEPAAAAPPAAPTNEASTTTTTSAAPAYAASGAFPEPVVEHASAQRVVGWSLLGVGAAGLVTAGFFGLRSLDRRNEARDRCTGDLCDVRGVELRAEAIRAGNVSTIATVAGGALLAGGVVLLATAPRDRAHGARSATRPTAVSDRPTSVLTASAGFVPGGAGLVLGGTLP